MNEQLFIKDKINRMFLKITQTIDSFIKYLADIYKENGVNYPIMHLQDVITRILTPYELLTEHRIVDNSDLIIRENFLPDFLAKNDLKPVSQKYNFVSNTSSLYSQPLSSKISTAPNPNSYSFPLSSSLASMIQVPMEPARKGGRPRALSPQLQHQLAKWVIFTASQGKQITRKDVTSLACQLLNDETFEGSDGWFSNFLRRHPQIKKLVIRKRKNGIITNNSVDRAAVGVMMAANQGNENMYKNVDFYPMQNKRIPEPRSSKYYLSNNRILEKDIAANQQNMQQNDDQNQEQKQSYLKYKDEESENKQQPSDEDLDVNIDADGDAFVKTEDNQQSQQQQYQQGTNNNLENQNDGKNQDKK